MAEPVSTVPIPDEALEAAATRIKLECSDRPGDELMIAGTGALIGLVAAAPFIARAAQVQVLRGLLSFVGDYGDELQGQRQLTDWAEARIAELEVQ